MRGLLPATIVALALLHGGVVMAGEQSTADTTDRARELSRGSYRVLRPLREGEDPEDLAAEILAFDAAAATLGDDGWRVRARCARSLRDIADVSPTARDALERMADDTAALFREGLVPNGSGDAWVYAMHGLGRFDEVMAWIEKRIEDEPRRSRRFAASWSSMDDAMVAACRYDLIGQVHGDMKDEALRRIASRAEYAKKDEERRAGRERLAFSPFLHEEFSGPRRSALLTLDSVAVCHAALLVAGKDDDAWAVADAALEAHDTPEARASLAMHAVRAGVAGPRHAEWLAQAIERIPEDLQAIERTAVDADMKRSHELVGLETFAGREAAIERLEQSDDPWVQENAKALRQRLEEYREMMKERDDEPPY